MKRLSFFAAFIAIVLVGTSSFKSQDKPAGTVYGLLLNNNGDLIIYDLTGLTQGPTGDYDCVNQGDCKITLTSGTPIQDPDDERKFTVEDGTYDVVEEGTFVLN
ncbi:MAG: hypothetical protein JNK08_09745 [Sediminibacterium sp.]|nr:hypothetical protein [Sediminibacterium sp.]